METLKLNKVISSNKIPFLNIRQTNEWEKYFNSVGWNSFRLSNKSLVFYRKTLIGTIAKMTRPSKLDKNLLKELEDKCREYKCIFLKVEPDINQELTLLESYNYLKNNSPLIPSKTMYINLRLSEKKLWNDISHSGKYAITRGEREQTTVKFIKNPSEKQLTSFYQKIVIYRADIKKYHVPTLNDFLLRNTAFKPNTYLSLVYDKDNNLCGGKFYLAYDNIAYYLFGGTTDIGTKNKSGFVQMWESIKYFKSIGFKILDLDGIYDERFPLFNKGWTGFSNFKEKFGGIIIKYPHPYIKYFYPTIRFIINLLKLDI